MNLFVDGLPGYVTIQEQKIKIETGFRTGILFEEVMQDDSLSNEEKLLTMLELYYPDTDLTAEMLEAAVKKAIWFYRSGKDVPEETSGDTGKVVFSYEYDADYVYAAFMQAYRIDLTKENLHWWQFNALFKALPEDTQIVKIIGYRTMKIPAKATKEQKEYYRRMKRIYALPDSFKQTQEESDLAEILLKGGNPTKLLGRQ